MNYLKKITLEGYKSFKKTELDLNAVNVLIGPNGAGKSNFLSFFKLLSFMMTDNLQEYIGRKGGSNRLLYYGKKRTSSFSAKLDFEAQGGLNTYEFVLRHSIDDKMIFNSEMLSFESYGEKGYTRNFPYVHKETAINEVLNSSETDSAESEICKAFKDEIGKWRLFQFHDTSDTSKMREPAYLDDNRYLRDNAVNLAPYLYMLKNRHWKHYQQIIKTLRRIMPYFGDFELEPLGLNEKLNQLDWKEKGSDNDLFGPDQLSDGSLRFIALTTLLMQPKELFPGLIIIDEPELGLHPKAIRILASMVKAASEHTQIILATQSKTLLDEFLPEDIIVLDREPDEPERYKSEFRRYDSKELSSWLEEYTMGDIWDKDLIGGRP